MSCVVGTPLVNVDFVKAVGSSRIFLNWTVNNGNEPVQQYFMQVRFNDIVRFRLLICKDTINSIHIFIFILTAYEKWNWILDSLQ